MAGVERIDRVRSIAIVYDCSMAGGRPNQRGRESHGNGAKRITSEKGGRFRLYAIGRAMASASKLEGLAFGSIAP